MFELIKHGTKIDFLGWARVYFIISGLLVVGSLALIFGKGFNYGVDFSGGTVVQVKFENVPDIEVMRNVLNNAVEGKVSIQNFGGELDFMIKAEQTSEDLQVVATSIQQALLDNIKDGGSITIERVEQVGPQVGKDLKYKALMAVLYAVIGILIYIAVRFQFIYGIGAIIALVHDIILTLAVIILAGISFDLTVLASVLTVVGYSLNDKIVVFDRIRENVKGSPDVPLMQIMNKSINETLSRTILTSTSTLLALISLYFFGGEVIHGFSLAMIVGIIIGTYSSIGIASSSVYFIKKITSDKKSGAKA
ncbi:MAG: protein translocase subunit SecF [Deferribacterales bacterium]|nr:protein translocase subunit SecF [Deferribacterales bacterium]